MNTHHDSENDDRHDEATYQADRMRLLAQALMEKTRQGGIHWTSWGAGEYIAKIEDLALKIYCDSAGGILRLMNEHSRTAAELAAPTDAHGDLEQADAALLKEIHRLAAGQVRQRTLQRAMEYLRDMDREPDAAGHRPTGPRPLVWLRARLGL